MNDDYKERYPLLEDIRKELTRILNENDYLRMENERLKHYERKYFELLHSNIKRDNEMVGMMLTSCLKSSDK